MIPHDAALLLLPLLLLAPGAAAQSPAVLTGGGGGGPAVTPAGAAAAKPAAGAKPPPPAKPQQLPAPARARDPASSAAAAAAAGAGAAWTCPGITANACAAPCQRAVCDALALFFKSGYNASFPWNSIKGWETTRTLGCERIVAMPSPGGGGGGGGGMRPAYCSWPGLACCTPAEAAAGRCRVVNAVANVSMPVNQYNASASDPGMLSALERLHACGLVVIDLEANELSGEVSPRFARLTNLRVLNLANNWIGGRVPDLSALAELRRLELGTNFLHGALGDWVSGLVHLEVLGLGANSGANPGAEGDDVTGIVGAIPKGIGALTRLVELDLQTNALTGTVPADLCGPDTRLRVLNLRSNRLRGPATSLARCTALAQLDVASNALTGALPASRAWEQLVTLSLGNNKFGGSIPTELYFLPTLTYLDLSRNALTGSLEVDINLLTYLRELDVSSNNLTGEVGVDVFYLPQLSRLNMANNDLSGTIADSIGLAFGLTELSLSGNGGLVGPLPNEAGYLK